MREEKPLPPVCFPFEDRSSGEVSFVVGHFAVLGDRAAFPILFSDVAVVLPNFLREIFAFTDLRRGVLSARNAVNDPGRFLYCRPVFRAGDLASYGCRRLVGRCARLLFWKCGPRLRSFLGCTAPARVSEFRQSMSSASVFQHSPHYMHLM